MSVSKEKCAFSCLILLLVLLLLTLNNTFVTKTSSNGSTLISKKPVIFKSNLSLSQLTYLESKSCLLFWYHKTEQCGAGGLKGMILNMISYGILEAAYRNCTYLILDKYFRLTQAHESRKPHIHYNYSYWDFFDVPNIEIINTNNNVSTQINIFSSEYFEQNMRNVLNLSKLQILTTHETFRCNVNETNEHYILIREPKNCKAVPHKSCDSYWDQYKVYLPFTLNILNDFVDVMQNMMHNVMFGTSTNYNNYCWLTLMIRRGDRIKQYTASHIFGMAPEGITVILFYFMKQFCRNDNHTATIVYIAMEHTDEYAQYISKINTLVSKYINHIHILTSDDLCNYYDHCDNNYLLFCLERLMLFQSDVNFLAPSNKFQMHVNAYLNRKSHTNISYIITNGSVWFHPQSGYCCVSLMTKTARDNRFAKYSDGIVLIKNYDNRVHLKYKDMISTYINMNEHNLSNSMRKFLNYWNLTNSINNKSCSFSQMVASKLKKLKQHSNIMSIVDTESKSCLLWYTKTKQCQVGGLKAMIKNMISYGILEAVYRNCTYLILDKYFQLTAKHDTITSTEHNYSYWDFFDLSNIKIDNIQTNSSIKLKIKSSEYFQQNMIKELSITKKDMFTCDMDKNDGDEFPNMLIRAPSICKPWPVESCNNFWDSYKVYLPFKYDILHGYINVMNQMINEVMMHTHYNGYCWISLMIRRGDRMEQYSAAHQFGIKPAGITAILFYVIRQFCHNDNKTAKIIYIAQEHTEDHIEYLSKIINLVNIHVNYGNDIHILSSANLCKYYNHCDNNYLLFCLERLMLFHSDINFLEPSDEFAERMHVNSYLSRKSIRNMSYMITNGSIWFHPQSGYSCADSNPKKNYSQHFDEIMFTTNEDIVHRIKYKDIISLYSKKMHNSLPNFLYKWNLTVSKKDRTCQNKTSKFTSPKKIL
eukprot:159773_1